MKPWAWSKPSSGAEAAIKRVLALDVGDSRIGVAVSDALGILASPVTIINRANIEADIKAVLDIAREKSAGLIIIGLPVSMDGSFGRQAEKVNEFAASLRKSTEIPVEFRDERLSTVSARRMIQTSRKTGRGTRYDAAAAALVLQAYLDEAAQRPDTGEGESL